MSHYLAYHNPDNNPAPAQLLTPGCYTWGLRNRSIQRGDYIWLLTRVGEEYFIHHVYEFGEMERLRNGRYRYLGQGMPRLIEAKITGTPLYNHLRHEAAGFINFAAILSNTSVRLLEAL